MMKVNTPTGEVDIRFTHLIPVETQCRIISGENLIATGFASCSDKDNYSREKGRKVAMQRALMHAGFSKELRSEIWNIYLQRPRGN